MPGLAKVNSQLTGEIAERKLAEAARRESEERLHFVAERAQVGYWHWELVPDRLEWSTLCKRLFGIPAEENMTYLRFLAATHPKDRERTELAVQECLQSGGAKDYDIEYRTVLPEWYRAMDPSQGERHLRKRTAGADGGHRAGCHGRKTAEQARIHSEERLRLPPMPPNWALDLETGDGPGPWENDWPCTILGLPKGTESVRAARFRADILHPEDRAAFDLAVNEANPTRRQVQFQGSRPSSRRGKSAGSS